MVSHREHGTYAKYVIDKCHCDDCRIANRDYERARKLRTVPPYVSAERARAHIRDLMVHGIGPKSIADVSGVPHGGISKLVYGDYTNGRGPSKRIRRETEQKILAVTLDNAAGGTCEPNGPTLAIVEQLVARGWTKAAISRAIGQGGPALQLGAVYVTRRQARTIRGLLEQPVPPRRSRFGLHPVAPPDPAIEREHERARLAAEAEQRRFYRARQRADATVILDDVVDADELGEDIQAADPYELPTLIIDADLSWKDAGACHRPETPNWMFFPARGDTATLHAAREVCARCPVVEQCLDYALTIGVKVGIWGGKSERERRALRREKAIAS